jgi:hypothetical protein
MLMEQIRCWLNSNRKYNEGVALYADTIICDPKLLSLFLKGESKFCIKKLNDLLVNFYDEQIADPSPIVNIIPKVQKQEVVNSELYDKCKKDADLLYKETMNKRAILFASIKGLGDDVNRVDHIEQRKNLCIEVVEEFNQVGKLYDDAKYVAANGSLPEVKIKSKEWDYIPDNLVKSTLDNLRKSYNKMKVLPTTPERIIKLQDKEKGIKILEEKWLYLKSTKN